MSRTSSPAGSARGRSLRPGREGVLVASNQLARSSFHLYVGGRQSLVVAVCALAVGCLVLGGAARAARQLPEQKAALAAVQKAVAGGYLTGSHAAADRAEIARAARLVRGLPASRGRPIAVALAQAGALAGKLSAPRAAAVFGQLKANDDYFALHWAPAPKTDIKGADGLVYRWFPGRCLEFHPLAEFGALNARVAARDVDGARTLADALIARGVHENGGGIGWEYDFAFGGGRAPWLSGMAQAVAAQAFQGAAALVPDRSSAYEQQAAAAFQAIGTHLLTHVAAGPWIRLYSFQTMPVLNAQLQTVLSLQSYATASGDAKATALATQLERSAAATLTRFDTGWWTLYSLGGDATPIDYAEYVNQLLARLSKQDARFADAAARFKGYLAQPPAFRVANAGLGQVRFWLSKPSSVTLSSGAGPTRRLALGAGWHTVGWNEPKRPGVYAVGVHATDWAGNSASFQALPIVRAAAAGTPPKRTAASAAATPTFTVGAGIDDPSQAPLAAKLGLRTVRLAVAWPGDDSPPDPAELAALAALPASTSLVLELDLAQPPVDPAGGSALGSYAAALAAAVPQLHDLLVGPAPTTATAPTYAAALNAVAAAVAATRPDVTVGAPVDGTSAPKGVVAALGTALGGQPPALVAFRPATAAASGAWTTANVPQLTAALTAAFGTAPPVLLDGVTAAEPTGYAQAVSSAACTPGLAGVLLDRLEDGDDASDGLLTAGGTAKPGAAQLTAALAATAHGTQVCPGVAFPAAASTVKFPTSLASPRPSIQLGCVRDCLYLATLDGPDGRPVVAKRGALAGGAAPTAVVLPAAKLGGGPYRLDVRLVSQANPGPLTQLRSPPLTR
jgi:D-glucuronyl C5-epimerase-like protein